MSVSQTRRRSIAISFPAGKHFRVWRIMKWRSLWRQKVSTTEEIGTCLCSIMPLSSMLQVLVEYRNLHAVVMVHSAKKCNHRYHGKREGFICGSQKLEDYCVHTNHSVVIQECTYLSLPLSVHKNIWEKFSQGVTLERIMSGKYLYIYKHFTQDSTIILCICAPMLDFDLGSHHQRKAFDCCDACWKIRDFANY